MPWLCCSGDYMNKDLLYEDITDIAALKKCMNNYLQEYNNSPGVVPMDLVLFRDAMEHGQSEAATAACSRFQHSLVWLLGNKHTFFVIPFSLFGAGHCV